MTQLQKPTPAKVFLVGAGPGDPGLITLRGIECLEQADVILYDYLINPRLLQHAKPDAVLQSLGKHGAERSGSGFNADSPAILSGAKHTNKPPESSQRLWSQDEINARVVEFAKSGKKVVRLKSGDPGIFGRLAEECQVLIENEVPFEIVPGITAALAATSYAGIFVTHRDTSSAVALVTGHEQCDKNESAIDYKSLANFPGTIVFYMGITKAREWSSELLKAGKPPTTPVAIVRRCTWPDQSVLNTQLDRVADEIESRHLRPPVIVIVGQVAAAERVASWFTERPLLGKKILVTRAEEQAGDLAKLLETEGATCVFQPTIEIGLPRDVAAVDRMLRRLDDFDWIVFSSSNGVESFWKRLWELGLDGRKLKNCKIAAIGPATNAALEAVHLRAELIPTEYRAESLAEAVIKRISNDCKDRKSIDTSKGPNQKILLIRASRGREVLTEMLTAAGHSVEQVVCYESTDVESPRAEVKAMLDEGKIDVVTVTSSAIARSLVKMFGDSLRSAKLASLSPVTSESLRELGYEVAIEATEYTMSGLVSEIVNKVGN